MKTPVVVSEAMMVLGIPRAEIELILVNSHRADEGHKLKEGDFVSVYPTFETIDISPLTGRRDKPEPEMRFIADAHLGKLSKYLRMLGFDTLYRNDFGDDEIIHIALNEERIILTRDRMLLNSTRVRRGYYLRATDKHALLTEVVARFGLKSLFKPFSRCMTCNQPLVLKASAELTALVDAPTLARFDEFYYCANCRKVFWKGSHFKRMEALILQIASGPQNRRGWRGTSACD
ncbi:Mut7-C RNAse domain-containing protein [Mangrovibacterium marinum]|uniref:Mut7-C RNAse domain-containing protein n=1 Tax=Mangrovibacterium marinum TaxID=1639118 RepID=UPI000D30AFC2|nr:Mut7-C RNAse domain-containing protein [Mangrovibacterium marinum]